MLILRLPLDIEKRLDSLSKKIGRKKSYFAREAIIKYINDMEDLNLAEKELEAIRKGAKTYSLDEVEKELGLEEEKIVTKEYDVKIDKKHNVILLEAKYEHYRVKEFEDGRIELEPRELVKPMDISARTLKAMDASVNNLKKGKTGKVVNLDKFKKSKGKK